MPNKNLPDVSVVIPNYNGEALLAKNLPLVLQTRDNPQNRILEIIVVDDGSSDKSAELVKSRFPSVRLIKHKVNRGFSSAVNTGARMAKGKLIALLNSDVIPDNNFLEAALTHFADSKVFAVSFHERDYSWAKAAFKDGYVSHQSGPVTPLAHISFWASGGSAIFRRDYWMLLNGMDEKLFSPFYWEDIDLCYRAAKRGLAVLWEPNAFVTHKHETTISRLPSKYTARIRERNELLFLWKNITSPALFRKHLSGLFSRTVRHPGYMLVVLMALKKLPVALKARRKERKEAKLSDEAIFARFRG